MINPNEITKFNRTDAELEEFLLFSVFVQGHDSMQTAELLDIFLGLHREGLDSQGNPVSQPSPFEKIRLMISKGELMHSLKAARLGKYRAYSKFLTELIDRKIDARTASIEALEQLHSMGPKTSRFFILHSRLGIKCAVLDTHLLTWMRNNGYPTAPKSTPPMGWHYNRWEQAFINAARARFEDDDHEVEWHKVDLMLWKEGRAKAPKQVNILTRLSYSVFPPKRVPYVPVAERKRRKAEREARKNQKVN